MKDKYKRELRTNGDRIASVLENVRFHPDICKMLAQVAKSNEFQLKDEEYFEDSDDALENEKQKLFEEPKPEDDAVFNPHGDFKLDHLEDIDSRIAIKEEENEKLKQWRRDKERQDSEALQQFKAEQREYQQIKKQQKAQESTRKVINGNAHSSTAVDDRELNENERALQRAQPGQDGQGQNGAVAEMEADSLEFDPFSMFSENENAAGNAVRESAENSGSAVDEKKESAQIPYEEMNEQYQQFEEEEFVEFEGDEFADNMMMDPF